VAEKFSCVSTGDRHSVHLGVDRACDRRLQLLEYGLDIVGWAHSHPSTLPHERLRMSDTDEEQVTMWASKFGSIIALLVGQTRGLDWPDAPRWHPLRLESWLVHPDTTIREADLIVER